MVLAGDPRELGLAYAITCGDEAVLTAATTCDSWSRIPRPARLHVPGDDSRPDRLRRGGRGAHAAGKRIFVLKVGVASSGSRRSAHTGRLAARTKVYDAFSAAMGSSRRDARADVQTGSSHGVSERIDRGGVVAITMSGGIGALVADTAEDAGSSCPRSLRPTLSTKMRFPAAWRPRPPRRSRSGRESSPGTCRRAGRGDPRPRIAGSRPPSGRPRRRT